MRKFLTALFALAFFVPSVFAGGTISLMGIGAATSGPPPFSFTSNGNATNASGTTSVSGSIAAGSDDPSRQVVIIATCNFVLNGTIASPQINGAAATVVANIQGTGSSAPRSAVAIFRRAVATGSTVTYSFSGAQNFQGCRIASYSIYNATNASPTACTGQSSCSLANSAGGGAAWGTSGQSCTGGTITATQEYSVQTTTNRCSVGGSSTGTSGSNISVSSSLSGGTLSSQSLAAFAWR